MLEFKTEKFSGPLALLLSLIEREELDITEISLAKIADEYVANVRQAENINPEELADFLVLAAKLLWIKSKALLPYLVNSEEEAELQDLTQQLRMYKEFVEASQGIKTLISRKHYLFLPPISKKHRSANFNLPLFSPPAKIKTSLLHEHFLQVLLDFTKRAEKKLPEKILEPKISIDEKISFIKKLLERQLKINFSKLLLSAKTKTEIIVNFLAVLELAKQRKLIFEQEGLFSEIELLPYLK